MEQAEAVPWSTFLSRTSPSAVVNRLNSILAQHFENINIAQRRTNQGQHKRGRSNSYQPKTKTKLNLWSKLFRGDQKPIQVVKTSVVEDHCLALIDVIGNRARIKYNSDAEKTEAQFAFLNMVSSLAQYSRKSSFDAKNCLGIGIHMPKSVHVAVYKAIIAVIGRPEFDFRGLIQTSSPLTGSNAHIAGEYWRILVTVLQLVLDLVFWAREEEMQFAANFFAIAIFRLPSVGGHVIDSLHQFYSRAAAHYRRLYPASTRSSELEHARRKHARGSSTGGTGGTGGTGSGGTGSGGINSRRRNDIGSNNNTANTTNTNSATFETKSSSSRPTNTLPSTTAFPSSPPSLESSTAAPPPPSPTTTTATTKLKRAFSRTRSSSKQSFEFIHANPVIFGWLTFQSKVPGVNSGRVVELMRKRKKEWNDRLRSSREFAMMLAASVVDHVQDVVASGTGLIWWEEVPLYPVLADMVLLTLRRQFHLLVHPTDPSALDDYETRAALRSSSNSFDYDKSRAARNAARTTTATGYRRTDGFYDDDEYKSNPTTTNNGPEETSEEQEGNLVFSLPFFNSIVKTCSHFFSADPVMRHALLRMVCRYIDAERVSSVGPCLNALEGWLFRLHQVSPISMTKAMQLPCIRNTIYSLLKSSRFVCTCRGLTFITTVVQHLSGNADDEAVLWFLRDILFDLFFELMLSWSSFVRRFFHDFLIHRVFKLKRALLDMPTDRRLFEMFPGCENNGERVRAYDLARSEFATNRIVKTRKNKARGRRPSRFDNKNKNKRTRTGQNDHRLGTRPDAAALSPSDMALSTKMEAYMRILLCAVNDPSSFDDHCCPNSDQRRGYILVSLESFSDTLFEYYKDCGARTEDAGEYFEGEPPEMEISIDALMKRFAEGH
jgi:hypothetical protein